MFSIEISQCFKTGSKTILNSFKKSELGLSIFLTDLIVANDV